MSNFPTPLEEVIHHNVIKNNKTGGPVLDVGQMQLLWRALGENTGYTFSIFEMTVVPGMGIPLHRHPFAEFFYVLEGTLAIGYCVNVSPRADDEGCCASGWQDRLLACSTHSGRLSEIDEVDGEEPDIPCRRPRLETMISMVHLLSSPLNSRDAPRAVRGDIRVRTTICLVQFLRR
jgi:hypothetical protein